MRRVETVSGPESLSRTALERTAHEAGQHLGELHSAATFDGYGWLRAGMDADSEPTVDDLSIADVEPDWPSRVRSYAEENLARIEASERFADLTDELRAGLDEHLEAVPETPDPVLLHDDYRFGNLLLDPDTGAVETVLDWGNQFTGHREFDLATTEHYLCGRRPLDDERREIVHEALLSGYAETDELTRDDGFRRRQRAYRFVGQLPALAWFDLWYGGSDDPGENRESAERTRTVVASRVVVRVRRFYASGFRPRRPLRLSSSAASSSSCFRVQNASRMTRFVTAPCVVQCWA